MRPQTSQLELRHYCPQRGAHTVNAPSIMPSPHITPDCDRKRELIGANFHMALLSATVNALSLRSHFPHCHDGKRRWWRARGSSMGLCVRPRHCKLYTYHTFARLDRHAQSASYIYVAFGKAVCGGGRHMSWSDPRALSPHSVECQCVLSVRVCVSAMERFTPWWVRGCSAPPTWHLLPRTRRASCALQRASKQRDQRWWWHWSSPWVAAPCTRRTPP